MKKLTYIIVFVVILFSSVFAQEKKEEKKEPTTKETLLSMQKDVEIQFSQLSQQRQEIEARLYNIILEASKLQEKYNWIQAELKKLEPKPEKKEK